MPDTSTRPPQYTGADEELDSILEDAYVPWEAEDTYGALYMTAKSLEEAGALDDLLAWRDAAVARHLAEAGAVHPLVHTPARVQNWLEQRGWRMYSTTDIASLWAHPNWPGPHGWSLLLPLTVDGVDYVRRVTDLVQHAAMVGGVEAEQALLEIALRGGVVNVVKEWSWASGMFGAVPGVAYFAARCLEEPFGSVEVLFKNGFHALVTVNRNQSMVGRYELRVVDPDGEPARPVGLDDDTVIDALRAVSAQRVVLDTLNQPEGD